MKRLRKKFPQKKIRYFQCGEYGDNFGRPHYHACLFGIEFPDKIYAGQNNGIPFYNSKILSDLWGHGFVSIGDVTFQSAAYVARYIMKKITGDKQHEINPKTGLKHYEYIDTVYHEIITRKQEYTTMSRGGRGKGSGGIAKSWYDKNKNDLYPHDQLIIKNGDKYTSARIPRYYDNQYEIDEPQQFKLIKANRQAEAKANKLNNTPERLAVRETITSRNTNQLKRNYHAT